MSDHIGHLREPFDAPLKAEEAARKFAAPFSDDDNSYSFLIT